MQGDEGDWGPEGGVLSGQLEKLLPEPQSTASGSGHSRADEHQPEEWTQSPSAPCAGWSPRPLSSL